MTQSADNRGQQVHAERRVGAPLMSRSIPTTLEDGDDSSSSDSRAENDFHRINKRRYSLAVLGGRSWVTSKKRGPLFG